MKHRELCALRFCASVSLLSWSCHKPGVCAASAQVSLIEHPQHMGAMPGGSFPQMQTSVISDDPRQSKAGDSHFADGKPKAQNGGFSSLSLHSSGSKAFSSRQFVCWLGRDLWYPFWAMILVTLRTPMCPFVQEAVPLHGVSLA